MNTSTVQPKTRKGPIHRVAASGPNCAQDVLSSTSPAVYLSGTTALSIPAPEGTGGDWHLTTILHDPQSKLFVAGDSPKAFINTNPILGAMGIHECSQTLRAFGAALSQQTKVYAANHVRAILDLLLHRQQEGASADSIRADDFFDNESEFALLKTAVVTTANALPAKQKQYLLDWLNRQAV